MRRAVASLLGAKGSRSTVFLGAACGAGAVATAHFVMQPDKRPAGGGAEASLGVPLAWASALASVALCDAPSDVSRVKTSIMWAIRDGEFVTMKRLVKQHRVRANDSIASGGKTMLMLAAECGRVDVVRFLLARGADVHATDEKGFTALEYAAWKGHGAVLSLLLRAGARWDTRDIYGLTPLHKATGFGHQHVVAMLLGDAHADVNVATGEVTAPPSHMAEGSSLHDAPLHIASRWGDTGMMRLLLRHGAAIDAANRNGDTALHLAAGQGHAGAVVLLIGAGRLVGGGGVRGRRGPSVFTPPTAPRSSGAPTGVRNHAGQLPAQAGGSRMWMRALVHLGSGPLRHVYWLVGEAL